MGKGAGRPPQSKPLKPRTMRTRNQTQYIRTLHSLTGGVGVEPPKIEILFL